MNWGRALRQVSECLKGRIPENAEWTEILTLANQNWFTAELHVALKGVADDLPEDVRTFLGEVYRRNLERNSHLFSVMKDVLAPLNAANLEPVLVKGCATWAVADVVPSLPESGRTLSDIDLVAPPGKFEECVSALADGGFPVYEDCRDKAHHPGVVLWRKGDRTTIDLHQFSPGPRGIPAVDNIHANSRRIDFDGVYGRAPTAELQILITVLHDQLLDGHFWRGGFDFRHLIDIAALSRSPDGVDWRQLYNIADGAGLHAALSSQLIAAQRIAGADVPQTATRAMLGWLHYRRQRLQFVWPALNKPFHAIGLNKDVWRILSSRRLKTATQ